MILNNAALALMRNTEHRSNAYISIYEPTTIFACQVNDSGIEKGERAILYDGVTTSGTIRSDMLMLVGSSAGEDDYGDIRVKAISGAYIYVAENSDIQWQDDLHLTVLNYVPPNPIFPRIIQDPNNVEEVIFYKDYDIPYSNQNTVLGTFVCAGPHRAGFLVTGSYQVDFTASGSYNVKGDGLTYEWFFGNDATPTGSTARDPGIVNWSTVGHKSVRLIVSNASGGDDVAWRYVSIYDKPTEGNTLPPLKWELLSFSENRAEGGVTAKIRVHQILSNIRKHSLVVLWTDDWFGSTQGSLGGNYPNAADIFFNGFVLDGSIHYNYRESYTEFEAASLTNVMKDIENFPISIESNSNPSVWYEILTMNPPKAIYHFLRWHSTFLKIADWHYLDTTVPVQYFDSSREGMFDSLNTFCKTGMIGSVVADRQGTIWIEKAPEGQTAARTAYQIPMHLQKHDWIGDPDITERFKNAISYVELGGIAYTGPTGTSLAFIGAAPGLAPASIGNVESNQGLILSSQQQLNQLAGNVYAYRNSQYPDATFQLKGNYRNLDIAPLENIPITIDQQDTVRNIQLTDEPFHIQSMDWRYNATDGFLYISNIKFSQLVNGVIGDTIDIPVIPPTEIIIPPIPPISIPPIPPIELPEEFITGSASISPEVVLIVDRNAGILVTTNFDEDYPIWLPFNNGMPSGTYSNIGSVHMTPNGQLYVLTMESAGLGAPLNLAETGGTDLWYAPYFGSSFGHVLTHEIVQAYLGAGVSTPAIVSMGVDPTQNNAVAFCMMGQVAGLTNDVAIMFYGSPEEGFSIRSNPTEMRQAVGIDWTAGCLPMTYGDGKWVMPVLRDDLFQRTYWAVFSGDLTSMDGWIRMPYDATRPVMAVRADESARIYTLQYGNVNFAVSLQNGLDAATITGISVPGGPPYIYWQAADCDDTGQYIMKALGGSPPHIQRSLDYGYNWTNVTGTGLTAELYDVVQNGFTYEQWIVAKSAVYYTEDVGASWVDKSGNLSTLVSSPNIIQIIVVQ